MKVVCVGAGYVGASVMAIMAQKNPDSQFTLVDESTERIKQWNSEDMPIHEPGLAEALAEVKGKNLSFVTDDKFEEVISPSDDLSDAKTRSFISHSALTPLSDSRSSRRRMWSTWRWAFRRSSSGSGKGQPQTSLLGSTTLAEWRRASSVIRSRLSWSSLLSLSRSKCHDHACHKNGEKRNNPLKHEHALLKSQSSLKMQHSLLRRAR